MVDPEMPREANVAEPGAIPKSPVTIGGGGGSASLTLGDAMRGVRRGECGDAEVFHAMPPLVLPARRQV